MPFYLLIPLFKVILAGETVLTISVKKKREKLPIVLYSIHDKPDEDVLWLIFLLLL
jgi:hypothetical protein